MNVLRDTFFIYTDKDAVMILLVFVESSFMSKEGDHITGDKPFVHEVRIHTIHRCICFWNYKFRWFLFSDGWCIAHSNTTAEQFCNGILKSHRIILHDKADRITTCRIVVRVPTVISDPYLVLFPQMLCSKLLELFTMRIKKRDETFIVRRFDLLFCIVWHVTSFT